MKVYLLEVGVLLYPEHKEYKKYSGVYDKQHGFYDENQQYKLSIEDAVTEAREYVESGTDNTYAVVIETMLDCDGSEKALENIAVSGEAYDLESVVFSVAKKNSIVKENFLDQPKEKKCHLEE